MFFISRVNGIQDRYRGQEEHVESVEQSEDYKEKEREQTEEEEESLSSRMGKIKPPKGARGFPGEEGEKRKKREVKKLKQGKESLLASQIMGSTVFTISSDMTLEEAWELMSSRDVGHVPVLSADGKLIGMLTEHDLLKNIKEISSEEKKKPLVKEIMKTDILCASSDAEVRDIAKIFFNEQIGVMPIIDKNAHVIGILTRKDIFRTILKVTALDI